MTTRCLWTVPGIRISIQIVRVVLSVLVGPHSGERCPRLSERVLKRRVEEIAVLVTPGLVDEFSGGEVAVAGVALQVTREVVGAKQVRLRPDVAGPGSRSRTQHGPGCIVERIAIGRSPEEILLKRERKIAHRGYRDSGIGTDDVLPPDVVDVSKE